MHILVVTFLLPYSCMSCVVYICKLTKAINVPQAFLKVRDTCIDSLNLIWELSSVYQYVVNESRPLTNSEAACKYL